MNTPHQPREAATTAATATLRQRAEDRLNSGAAAAGPVQSLAEANQVLHELRVHQIELELQNEELRRSQADLDAARARYFDLYDLAPVGYVTVDGTGLILEANLTLALLLGMPRRALVKQLFSRPIYREDQDLYYRYRNQLLTTGEPQICELRMVKEDGTVFWAQLAGTTAADADGKPVCHIALNDITEPKHAADALRESEEKYRLLFESAGDAIFIHDPQARMLAVNTTACARLGYTHAELMSMVIAQVDSPTEAPHAPDRIARLLEHGYLAFETVHQRHDGSPVPTEVNARRITWNGQPAMMSICRDITARKVAEADKARLEAQLHQAQKMESVGRLAGGVAHDFNNMLLAILGNAALALEEIPPDSPARECLDEIQTCAKRSADLTRQLLAFARKQIATPLVLDLNATVGGMLKLLRRLIGEDIALTWTPQSDLWPVMMDPSQVDQILVNLCVNARDAICGVGNVTVEIANCTATEDDCAERVELVPGEYVRLAVRDSGCGMDTETCSHLFEPFFTTKDIGAGTGLGLATVYGIVKQNNGFINVDSEPSKGTTFTIYLPRYKGKDARLAKDAPAPAAMRGYETILLVEDESAILRLTKRTLERLGYTAVAASTPGEAICLAREHIGDIQLLLTDVVMPEMNGRDLAKSLLTLYPQLRRLFMSGYTADIIARDGVLDAGVYFIQKPFTVRELAAKVRGVLDSGRALEGRGVS